MNGLYKILKVARECKCAVYTPSPIGSFGPGTPLDNTPQDTIQRPNTMYGVTRSSSVITTTMNLVWIPAACAGWDKAILTDL